MGAEVLGDLPSETSHLSLLASKRVALRLGVQDNYYCSYSAPTCIFHFYPRHRRQWCASFQPSCSQNAGRNSRHAGAQQAPERLQPPTGPAHPIAERSSPIAVSRFRPGSRRLVPSSRAFCATMAGVPPPSTDQPPPPGHRQAGFRTVQATLRSARASRRRWPPFRLSSPLPGLSPLLHDTVPL